MKKSYSFVSAEPKQNWRETNINLISKIYHEQTGHIARLNKLNELTKHLKALEEEDQRLTKQHHGVIPSNKSANYMLYVKHKLRLFKKKFKSAMDKKMAKMRFEIYERRQETMSQICDDLVGPHERVRLALDSRPPIGQNSSIKSYLRTPLKLIMKSLAKHDKIDVVWIWEGFTTVTCSRCFGRSEISKSPHRFVLCKGYTEKIQYFHHRVTIALIRTKAIKCFEATNHHVRS